MSLTAGARARVLIVVGGLLVLLAVVLGSQKLSVGEVTCGSAFGASIGSSQTSVYGSRVVQDCRDAVSDRRFVALGIGVLGAAGLVGGGVMQRRSAPAA